MATTRFSLTAMLSTLLLILLHSYTTSASPLPTDQTTQLLKRAVYAPSNNYNCRSATHPNPVVFLHGLGATYYEDLNVLQDQLTSLGFCTFSLTYGNYDDFPWVGGLVSINQSAPVIAAFIKDVQTKTGASKVDLVGHSEGAFQTLYVTKFGGVASIIQNIVAIAPPTHGTSFAGLYTLAGSFNITAGVKAFLTTFGCTACSDLVTGGTAILRLNDGQPIVQPGTTVTVIASEHDELVTPTTTAFIQEEGVNNIYVQKACALDLVGHINEAYDTNVWNIVIGALNGNPNSKFSCSLGGLPFRQ